MKHFHLIKVLFLCLVLVCLFGTAISSPAVFAKAGQQKQVVASPSALGSSDWTMFSLNHSRFNAGEKTLGAANISRLALAWSISFVSNPANGIFAEPAIANGVVYVTNSDTTPNASLAALDEKTGKILWQSQLTASVGRGAPAVGNGMVYIADGFTVDAYNAATGAPIWSVTIDPIGAVVVDSGVVYVQSNLGYPDGPSSVYALDAKTGKTLWNVAEPTQLASSSPALANGVLYVGALDGTFYALDAKNGKTLWTAFLGTNNAIVTMPVIDSGIVYVEADNHGLFAFNATSGKQLWFAASNPYGGSPAVANGVVYLPTNGNIQAYDETTGRLIWEQQNSDNLYSATVANGVVYASAANYGVVAFDAKTGKLLFNYNSSDKGQDTSSPVVANGMVFFNSAYGYVNALALK